MNDARCERCGTLLDERGLCWEPHGHLLPDHVPTVIEWTNPVPTHAPKTDTPATQDERYVNALALKLLSTDLKTVARMLLQGEKERGELESTLAAERASRLQAEEAIKDFLEHMDKGMECCRISDFRRGVFEQCLSKPSVSPEQESPEF